MSVPPLSVVVVVLDGPESLVRCLEALAPGVSELGAEVLVPCDDLVAADLESRRPEVRFLRHAGRRTQAELRAAAFRAARGEVVALTEDHCIPPPQWCTAALEAHRRLPHPAIGGPVDRSARGSALAWALYLSDFGRYMSPCAEAPSPSLTDCNVTYKRSALEAIRPVWEREFHETVVHAALVARGGTLWMTPELGVGQRRLPRLGAALAERFVFGRLFAATRVVSAGAATRLALAAGSLVLPVILFARTAGLVCARRRHRGRFVRASPMIALLQGVWSAGELVGYLTGRR